MVYHNNAEFKRRKFLLTLELIEFNGHYYVSGDYETKSSTLVVFCSTHLVEHSTTFDNYCRARHGMPCCGKAAVSKKLFNREYSPFANRRFAQTLDKMRQAAFERIRPSSVGQDWRRTKEARIWEKQIRENWNNKCAITGKKSHLVMHHFFSGARYETVDIRNALLYEPNNGILLAEYFHRAFHKEFGFQRNTFQQFQTFVKSLETLISSQAQQECWEGSETRVNDPTILQSLQLERIMKLQERLENVKENLRKIFPTFMI